MIWDEPSKKFLYLGHIITSRSEAIALTGIGKTTRYVFPVPRGRIVEYLPTKECRNFPNRRAMYKVNVRLKSHAA